MKKERLIDNGWFRLCCGALLQGLSIDAPYNVFKGICLVGGTILLIDGWCKLK